MQRLGLSLMAVLMLSACSSVSDRYAFWRDSNPQATSAAKPNLADVPAAPNTQDAKADMDAMRQRLEADRNNSYAAAQNGGVLPDVAPIADPNPNALNIPGAPSNETAPSMNTGGMPTAPYNAAPVIAPPMQPQIAGNVQYNYAPDNTVYTYGNSNLQYGSSVSQQSSASPYQQQAMQEMATNPSVSINFDALGGGSDGNTGAGLSPVGLSGQPAVYFKHGSARLGAGDRQKIKELAQQLKSSPQSVVVIGHASQRTGLKSAVASKSANLAMSAKRANVVLHELARQGVDAKKLNVTASGDTGAGGKSTEAQDRRVDLLFDNY